MPKCWRFKRQWRKTLEHKIPCGKCSRKHIFAEELYLQDYKSVVDYSHRNC